MQLNIQAAEPKKIEKKQAKNALAQSQNEIVKQRTLKPKTQGAQTKGTFEDLIADLILQAKANDKIFIEEGVDEQELEFALLHYHVVEGDHTIISEDLM